MRSMKLAVILALAVASNAFAQDAKTVIDNASKALGAASLKSIRYSGSGQIYNVGQSPSPEAPWPRLNLNRYTRIVNYETPALREETMRSAPTAPRGSQPPPLLIQQVSGSTAWNGAGNNATAAPAAVEERLLQVWITPHGVLKAAAAGNATIKSQKAAGKTVNVLSFTGHGKYKVNATISDQNLVESVETWIPNAVLGDMLVETSYSNYKDFGGVQFPTRIVQKQGGFPALELNVSEVQPNFAAAISAPANVRQAPAPAIKVEAQKLADGVWYLTGGTHHSVAVEFKDHVAVIEGPQSDERAQAVIAEVKKTIANKPIRYLINTHHHFDHSGGVRAFAAEGATVVTHQINKAFYERTFKTPRTLAADPLAGKKAKVEAVGDKRVFTDGAQTLEVHHIRGNAHNDGILLAWLPKEKILVEADVYTPAAPNAPPPATPNPFSVNLYENIERLKLDVNQIAPLHGRLVTLADLRKAIGKT